MGTHTQLRSCEMCNLAAECIKEQRNLCQSWGRGDSLRLIYIHVYIFFALCMYVTCYSHSDEVHLSFYFFPLNIHLVAIGDFPILTLLLHTLYKSNKIHGLLFLLLPLHSLFFHFVCFSITIVAKRKCILLSMCQICHCIFRHCYLFSHAI